MELYFFEHALVAGLKIARIILSLKVIKAFRLKQRVNETILCIKYMLWLVILNAS